VRFGLVIRIAVTLAATARVFSLIGTAVLMVDFVVIVACENLDQARLIDESRAGFDGFDGEDGQLKFLV